MHKNQIQKQWCLLLHMQGLCDQMNQWKQCHHSYIYIVLYYVEVFI